VIPRGGADLVRHVKSNTRIPVLGHADGICAAYLAPDADPATAPALLVDSKTGYPAACNALETLLVHADALATGPDGAFARTVRALHDKDVTLRCDDASIAAARSALPSAPPSALQPSTPDDYDTEFLALTLAVKTVPSLDAAVAHINEHGSHHTDAILTASAPDAESFMARVDSAGVYWNASTRMADGMRYGFGTEVGISTNKIHSRGPVGLEGLTIYKYKLRGQGHVAADYGAGEGQKRFKHERMALD
jgi:glutamate-5-semialdehyde dehydrogenase